MVFCSAKSSNKHKNDDHSGLFFALASTTTILMQFNQQKTARVEGKNH
jgi:hypothetical protein